MDPQSHQSKPRKRKIRTAKVGTAREAIGELRKGHEVFILTFGQFSLIDALVALLEQTGPADVDISTWTAAAADLQTAGQLMRSAKIRQFRMVVDRSFINRQPGYVTTMRELFGDDCLRTFRSHAKFIVIRNDQWNLVVRTSMNLNENPRLEDLEISDDAEFADYFTALVDGIFDEVPAGCYSGDMTKLDAVPDSIERTQVSGVTTVSGLGTASTTP